MKERHHPRVESFKLNISGDFPGGSVVKTLHFHCRGRGFIPGQGTKIPHASRCGQKWKKKKKKKGFLKWIYLASSKIYHIDIFCVFCFLDVFIYNWRIIALQCRVGFWHINFFSPLIMAQWKVYHRQDLDIGSWILENVLGFTGRGEQSWGQIARSIQLTLTN